MIKMIIILFVLFCMVSEHRAACDPGYTSVTRVLLMPDGLGNCCPIKVTFCYKSTETALLIVYDTVEIMNPACASLFGPGLFNFMTKKIAAYYGGVATCPMLSQRVVDESKAPCYSSMNVPGSLGDRILFIPCGATTCRRTCYMCLSTTETDPCSGEPMLVYAGCINTVTVCEGSGPGALCGINTCSN